MIRKVSKENLNMSSSLLNHPESEASRLKKEKSMQFATDNFDASGKFNSQFVKPLQLNQELSSASLSSKNKSKSPSHPEIRVNLQLKPDIRSGSKLAKTHTKLSNSAAVTNQNSPGVPEKKGPLKQHHQRSQAFNADLKEWVG